MTFMDELSRALKVSVTDFVSLETIQDSRTLVSDGGDLVSLVMLRGYRGLMGKAELEEAVEKLFAGLPGLSRAGQALHIFYVRHGSGDRDAISRLQGPVRTGAVTGNLDVEDLLEGQADVLAARAMSHECCMVVRTRMGDDHLSGHESFLEGLVDAFRKASFRVSLLEVHEALRVCRSFLYPGRDFSGWVPLLPGDRIRPRLPGPFRRKRHISCPEDLSLIQPSLSSQLCDGGMENVDRNTLQVGTDIWGFLDVTLAPLVPRPFTELLEDLDRAGIPFRISFRLEGDPFSFLRFRRIMGEILSIANSRNRLISKAIHEASDLGRDTPYVSLRISLGTWAPKDDRALLEKRLSSLARSVEGWGECHVTRECGDPLESFMNTVPALSSTSTAPPVAIPLREALSLLPLQGSASPFTRGSGIFLTHDGRPWVYHDRSPDVARYIDIFVGSSGQGKSVTAGKILFDSMIAGTTTDGRLPFLGILDIGGSSSGVISLLQDSLPENRRHEAGFFTLQMDPSCAINPFDTQPGCRSAMPRERHFLACFLKNILTPAGWEAPDGIICELIPHVIEAVYRLRDDGQREGRPRPYGRGLEEAVDCILDGSGIVLPEEPLWWDVADSLFAAGYERQARLAQRRAVPVLADLPEAARDARVQGLFRHAVVSGGESVLDVFERMISSALKEFPVLSGSTRFDIQGARVCSLELGEVAPRGDGRQSALMYMLARHILVHSWWVGEEIFRYAPALYHDWYGERIRTQRSVPKTIFYEEYHRTGGLSSFRDLVIQDALEGRKWNMKLVLASQEPKHFDGDILAQASAVFLLGGARGEGSLEEVQRLFNLSPSALQVYRHGLTGPSARGTPFLMYLSTADGVEIHHLRCVLGASGLWALSSSPDDVVVRRMLQDHLGAKGARDLLARFYPLGSVRRELERRRQESEVSGPAGRKEGFAGRIVEELIREARV